MAAPTLAQLRTGLETRLKAITDVQASAYRLSSPTLPCVFVLGPEEVGYHEAMGNGMDDWTLTVMALVGTISDIGAQKLLDQMISPTGAKSVKVAIEGDKTLGGIIGAQELSVVKCTGYRVYGANQDTLGAEWQVHVIADGA